MSHLWRGVSPHIMAINVVVPMCDVRDHYHVCGHVSGQCHWPYRHICGHVCGHCHVCRAHTHATRTHATCTCTHSAQCGCGPLKICSMHLIAMTNSHIDAIQYSYLLSVIYQSGACIDGHGDMVTKVVGDSIFFSRGFRCSKCIRDDGMTYCLLQASHQPGQCRQPRRKSTNRAPIEESQPGAVPTHGA